MSSDHDERYRPAAPAWATVPTMPWQKVINTDDEEEPSELHSPHAKERISRQGSKRDSRYRV